MEDLHRHHFAGHQDGEHEWPTCVISQADRAVAHGVSTPEQTLAMLYERHASDIYTYLLARTGSVDDAADLTHGVFIRALQSFARYESWAGPSAASRSNMVKTNDLDERYADLLDAVAGDDMTEVDDFPQSLLTRAIADDARTIHFPVHPVETINKLIRVSRRLYQEHGREPTSEEIGFEMDLSPEKVREIVQLAQTPVSLAGPIGEEDDANLEGFIAADEEGLADAPTASEEN